jgi:hypothetical protein
MLHETRMKRTEGLGTLKGCHYTAYANSTKSVYCWKSNYAKMKKATELKQSRRMAQEEYQDHS